MSSNEGQSGGPAIFDESRAVAFAEVPHPTQGVGYSFWVLPRQDNGGHVCWVRRSAGSYRPDQRSFLYYSDTAINTLSRAIAALAHYEPWGIDDLG